MMREVRLALGLAAAFAASGCGTAYAQDAGSRRETPRVAAPAGPATTAVSDVASTGSVTPPLGDPDAEVRYAKPRRVIAPPVYGYPGPPLNPGGVPYDELFASPTPFDLPHLLVPPDDPYAY